MSDSKRHRDRTKTIQLRMTVTPEPEKPARKGFLTVIRGGGADLGLNALIEGDARLGRDPECELCLADPGVSWHHARISAGQGERYTIEDPGSTNGTRVSGRAVTGEQVLRDGEKIFLGDTVVRFSLADELELGFQREVAQLVGTDPLTGLESKRRFDDALDQALAGAGQDGSGLAVLMMDMDGIKWINDTHGHLFGAHCIRTAGRLIGRVIGRDGHACRWGGDEFTAFLPGADKQSGLDLAERIRHAVELADMDKDGVCLKPTISIGVAAFPGDAADVLDLVDAADQALYRAKFEGRNRVSD